MNLEEEKNSNKEWDDIKNQGPAKAYSQFYYLHESGQKEKSAALGAMIIDKYPESKEAIWIRKQMTGKESMPNVKIAIIITGILTLISLDDLVKSRQLTKIAFFRGPFTMC